MKNAVILTLVCWIFAGCVTGERISADHNYNYAHVFNNIRQPKPLVVNSRLERYSKHFGLWRGTERNGEWEFELLAPRAWVEEAKISFEPVPLGDSLRRPTISWWKPSVDRFDAFEMRYTSYPAAHLYVERNPKDESRIQVFVQRH
jgi:hypothetical protein